MSYLSQFRRNVAIREERQRLADEDNSEDKLICDLYVNPNGTSEVIIPKPKPKKAIHDNNSDS